MPGTRISKRAVFADSDTYRSAFDLVHCGDDELGATVQDRQRWIGFGDVEVELLVPAGLRGRMVVLARHLDERPRVIRGGRTPAMLTSMSGGQAGERIGPSLSSTG